MKNKTTDEMFDDRLQTMTEMSMDIFREECNAGLSKTSREARNKEFEAMRQVLVPILMYIEELEAKVSECPKKN